MARAPSSPGRGKPRPTGPDLPVLDPALHKATNALAAVRALDGKVDKMKEGLEESVNCGFKLLGEKFESASRETRDRFSAIEQRLAAQDANNATRAVQQDATQMSNLNALEQRLTSQVTGLREGLTASINQTKEGLMTWVQANFLPRETARAYVWFPALVVAAIVSGFIGLLFKMGGN